MIHPWTLNTGHVNTGHNHIDNFWNIKTVVFVHTIRSDVARAFRNRLSAIVIDNKCLHPCCTKLTLEYLILL